MSAVNLRSSGNKVDETSAFFSGLLILFLVLYPFWDTNSFYLKFSFIAVVHSNEGIFFCHTGSL